MAEKDDEAPQLAVVRSIRPPAEIGRTESPQNEEFADYTPAQLRQTVVDLRRQLGMISARKQETESLRAGAESRARDLSSDNLQLSNECVEQAKIIRQLRAENAKLSAELVALKAGRVQNVLRRLSDAVLGAKAKKKPQK